MITILTEPAEFITGFNDIIYRASSDNNAITKFFWFVTVTDYNNNPIAEFELTSSPDIGNETYIEIKNFVNRNFALDDTLGVPYLANHYQQITPGHLLELTVSCAETYTGTQVYASAKYCLPATLTRPQMLAGDPIVSYTNSNNLLKWLTLFDPNQNTLLASETKFISFFAEVEASITVKALVTFSDSTTETVDYVTFVIAQIYNPAVVCLTLARLLTLVTLPTGEKIVNVSLYVVNNVGTQTHENFNFFIDYRFYRLQKTFVWLNTKGAYSSAVFTGSQTVSAINKVEKLKKDLSNYNIYTASLNVHESVFYNKIRKRNFTISTGAKLLHEVIAIEEIVNSSKVWIYDINSPGEEKLLPVSFSGDVDLDDSDNTIKSLTLSYEYDLEMNSNL